MSGFKHHAARRGEPPMPEPLAYFLTWTTYGTWLPGDERGWVLRGEGFQLPAPIRVESAEHHMTEPPCTLDVEQRAIVEQTIKRHCQIRGWQCHAVQCRTNHVHVVLTADRDPKVVRDQLKAWCARKLKEMQAATGTERLRQKWWTEKASCRRIGDPESLDVVITYVLEAQDRHEPH